MLDIKEKFESEFAIYDLPEFLRAYDLFDKSELKFNGAQNMTIKDANEDNQSNIILQINRVVAPTKTIAMPDKFVTFTLKKENFAKLMRVTTLNLPDIAVKAMQRDYSAVDKKTPSNDYSIVVGSDKKFTAYFKTENFKMIPDDYDVQYRSKNKSFHK